MGKEQVNIASIIRSLSSEHVYYSPFYGYVLANSNEPSFIRLKDAETKCVVCSDISSNGKYCNDGEVVFFPSKQMRDWRKLLWKKGDVIALDKIQCIFLGWVSEKFTSFDCLIQMGKAVKKSVGEVCAGTSWRKLSAGEADIAIRSIEAGTDTMFDKDTCEFLPKVETFREGDFLHFEGKKKIVSILASHKGGSWYGHASILLDNMNLTLTDEHLICYDTDNCKVRKATEAEKQTFIDVLREKGLHWNDKSKKLESFANGYNFKPFDKVLVRDDEDEFWLPAFFARYEEGAEYPYRTIGHCDEGADVYWKQCVPYEGNEKDVYTYNEILPF